MTWLQAIGFAVNIIEFLLLDFFFRTYLHAGKLNAAKLVVNVALSTVLYWFNLMQNPFVNTSCVTVLFLLYAFIFCRSHLTKKIAFSIVYVALSTLTEVLCSFIFAGIGTTALIKIMENSFAYYFIGVLGKLMLLGALLFIRKKFPPSDYEDSGWDMLLLSFFPFSVVITTLVVLANSLQMQLWLLGLFSLLLAQTIMIFFVYNNAMQRKELERRVGLNDEIRQMNERLFHQQQQEMEALHRIKHEFKRHLMTVGDLAGQGRNADAQGYCHQVLGDIQQSEKLMHLQDFKNFTVSTIYARLVSSCTAAEITLTTDIRYSNFAFLRDIDATVLLNNLFDNALEACEATEENRWLSLEIYQAQGFVVIKLANACCHPIRVSGEALLSTKRHYDSVGVGMGQMLAIAERYGGYVTHSAEDGQFEAIVRLAVA